MKKGARQGFNSSVFKEAIKSCIPKSVPVQIFDAIVQAGSQNSETMTCFVDSCDSTCNNLEVRYHLCISDGIVVTPADDSVVTIAKTAFTDPYIVNATELNSIFIGIGNQSFGNNGSVQSFQSYISSGSTGSFGGFAKVIDETDSTGDVGLVARLNKLENDLNNLKTVLSSLCVTTIPEPGSGAPSAFQIAFSSALTGAPAPNPIPLPSSYCGKDLVETTKSLIENTNIIHGLTELP